MDSKMTEALKASLVESIGRAAREISAQHTPEQAAWLAGYCAGAAGVCQQLAAALAAGTAPAAAVSAVAAAAGAGSDEVTVLFASHSGNGKGFSKHVRARLEGAGFKVTVADMASYKPRDLKKEKNLLIIISTHGEGVPPPAAMEMFDVLGSSRAPRLEGLRYSVLALGDKTYVHYCKAGVDLDAWLEALGGVRICERTDCDVDFKPVAEAWLTRVVDSLAVARSGTAPSASAAVSPSVSVAVPVAAAPASREWGPRNPFQATVLAKVNLNGRGSEKETYHIELSTEGSGITYQPGDACGLMSRNTPKLVNELLYRLGLDGKEPVAAQNGRPLAEVLRDCEITVLTPDTLKKHNTFAASAKLNDVIFDVARLREYLYGRDFIDLLAEYPVAYTAADLLTVLRPIPARLYSIASSPATYKDEVHLLVSAVRFNTFGRNKEGVASTFWADRIAEGGQVPVFIKSNEGFRLPQDGNAPVIMIGPGTGVAPFRAFVEERAALGHKGKSWLFFGNPHFTTDFLYQTEWQDHLDKGRLSRMDVAFSRDQQEKIYVQHRVLQHSRDVYGWLNEGAFVYVCGDMRRMALDVNAAFAEVFVREGGFSAEAAADKVKGLKKTGRYLEDVY